MHEIQSVVDGMVASEDETAFDDAMTQKVLAGKSPRQRAAELVTGTKLYDAAERKRLYEGGKKAIAASRITI